MRLCPPIAGKSPGNLFFKMLGSGAGQGFSIWPDWSVYAHLSVWKSESAFEHWQENALMHDFHNKADGLITFELEPYQSKGTWNGLKPFQAKSDVADSALMAVITRASIKKRRLLQFWRQVPQVSKVINRQSALLFQKGIGEWPLVEQATFSIWDAEAAMKNFAYQQEEHRKVVQLTRKLDWYKEEQFTRFNIQSWHGDWPKTDFDKLKTYSLNGKSTIG